LSKFITQKKQNKDQWFSSVVKNAVLFLRQSVDNLETAPRNSIIDLYTAIELLFKARLMKEHWSLILTKPEDAKVTSFENGDFHSVFLEQSEKRLKNICGESFKKEAITNFKALGEHRNQIVHFAHTSFDNKSDKLVLEHWRSWFYLHDLLKSQWSDIFSDFQFHIDSLHKKMQNKKQFLQVKYEAIYKNIEIERNKSSEIAHCPSCSFEAALILGTSYWGRQFRCMVCDVKDSIPKDIEGTIPCENCTEEFPYFMVDNHECPSCKVVNNPSYALDEYTKIYRADFDEEEEMEGIEGVDFDSVQDLYPIGLCHKCKAETPSVVPVDGYPVCLFCEVRGWVVQLCEPCDIHVTGDPDTIKYFACHLCEDEASESLSQELSSFEDEMTGNS